MSLLPDLIVSTVSSDVLLELKKALALLGEPDEEEEPVEALVAAPRKA